jgi:hypothetical protein
MPRAAMSVATRNSNRFAELVHHPVALSLVHVAMEPVGHVTLRFEMIHEIVHHPFGVAENDSKFEVVKINQPGQQFNFVAAIHS